MGASLSLGVFHERAEVETEGDWRGDLLKMVC
jgi:hypothetical protein